MTAQRLAPTISYFSPEEIERIRVRHSNAVESGTKGAWSGAYADDVGILLRVLDSRPAIDANVDVVSESHGPAARETAARMLPRSGAKRRAVYDWIASRGTTGATAAEVGAHFGWQHQTYSSAVSSLSASGRLVPARHPDGEIRTRTTPQGNPATVWIAVPA